MLAMRVCAGLCTARPRKRFDRGEKGCPVAVLLEWPTPVLTVKFRQTSHEFTFGVGMDFISYPLVLTPWCNKFVCVCRFWSLVFMHVFSVESKTSGISSLRTS
jgi:hypothetical protein